MIPVKLKMRNFIAYRDASLDFQGIHLAVLTGANGSGKSSLLDAITWNLWGKSRVGSKSDELIHLGQTEMEVEYSFELGDNLYRIIRKRDASKRGRSDLSFQVDDAGGWKTLTETSIRNTQHKINHILRLDYDTFINSAFLLQGKADEFTMKTPSKRKEILADILGLGIYEHYEAQAKKLAVEQEKETARFLAKIEHIEQELSREPEYRTELLEAEQESIKLDKESAEAEESMLSLREQYRAVNDKQRQLDDLCERLEQDLADMAEISEVMSAMQANIVRYQAVLEHHIDIEAGLKKLIATRETVGDWERRLQSSVKLSNRKHELDKAFQAARTEIEVDLREVRTKIDMLSPKVVAAEEQKTMLADAQAGLEALQAIAEEQEKREMAQTSLKEEMAGLKEQNKQLKVEMDDIKANLTQLEEAGSACPVCKHTLDEMHRTDVIAQFQEEGTTKGDRFRENKARLREITKQQKQLQQDITEGERKLHQMASLQRKTARLTQSLEEAEKAAVDLGQAQGRQTVLQNRLNNKEFAAEVIAALSDVKVELAELGYDEEVHRQARKQVEELSHFEDDNRVLSGAEQSINESEGRLKRESTRHARLVEQIAVDRQKIDGLEKETADLPELSQKLNQASADVTRLQKEARFAHDKVAAANQKLGHIIYLAKQRGELEKQIQQIRELQSIYRELQLAFGKKGVQALLIESAIPEIENEANELLSRMTDSRMHVRFETRREAKSSDNSIETLDIRIADELGSRDYELYSGGEAFRVNFAIRIALSKTLARRAGAQLQTLIIDEGFGTQDGQGKERLVNAINTIQDDFEKIIVITHIEELKEAFPVQIDVWKTDNGSHIAIR